MKFLSDIPSKEDELRTHKPLAKSLLRHIEAEYDGSFVIGLFGNWGAGKTSIIKWLKKLITANTSIAFAELDAWQSGEKYFGVSFVRAITFSCLPPWKRKKILKRISTRETKQTSYTSTRNLKFISLLFVILLLALIVFSYKMQLANPSFPWTNLASLLFTGLVAIFIQFFVSNFAVRTKTDQTDISFEQADHFQGILIKEILNNIANPILCVVVDNVDRLEPSEAFEVIRKLKTFIIDQKKLQKSRKKFVIIVPVDDRLLSKHIERVYSLQADDSSAQEFLRKFFNISLRIPDPIRSDLFSFTQKALNEAYDGEPNSRIKDVAHVINRAANKNPRDVKYLINRFISLLLLLDSIEEKNKAIETLRKNHHWIAFYVSAAFVAGEDKLPDTRAGLTSLQNQMDIRSDDKIKTQQYISDFVTSTKSVWIAIPEEAWFWLRHQKFSENLIMYPAFDKIYDLCAAIKPNEVWPLIRDITELEARDLVHRLIVESPGNDKGIVNICESILRVLDLGFDTKFLPNELIEVIESYLLQETEFSQQLIIGPLSQVATMLKPVTIPHVFNVIHAEFKRISEDNSYKKNQVTEENLDFVNRYAQLDIKNGDLPGIPSSILNYAIQERPEIAEVLLARPHLVTSEVAKKLARALVKEEISTEEELINKFLVESELSVTWEFYGVFLPEFVEKIKNSKSADLVVNKSLYVICARLLSSEHGSKIEGYLSSVDTLLDNLAEHLGSRKTGEEKFYAILIANAAKTNTEHQALLTKAASVQNQFGAGIYQQVDTQTLANRIVQFPSAFAALSEDHLVEIGKLDANLYKIILDAKTPNWRNIIKRLLLHSFADGHKWILGPHSADDKVVILETITQLAEDNQCLLGYYSLLKGFSFGRNRNDVREIVHQHYKKVIAQTDFTIPNNVENLARIINAFEVPPSAEQQTKIETNLEQISISGFGDKAKMLRDVAKGKFFNDKIDYIS